MKAAVIVAVLPEYRASFLDEVHELLDDGDDTLVAVAGDSHLDGTVRSAHHRGVHRVQNRHLLGRRLLWQRGALRLVRGADVVVTDLNPRSLTAWLLVARGRATGTRTLVWGHVHPRQGPQARTAPLRRAMRRLAHGVISYTWTDAEVVRAERPPDTVWVAANGLYRSAQLAWEPGAERDAILYVGRLEPNKKPALALEAFATALPTLPRAARLVFVGDGSLRPGLEVLARDLDVTDRVEFRGHVGDVEELRTLYASAAASVSPGYAGLSLTQSLGFGVPMIVADDEPHAPEIELLTSDTGRYFAAGDAEALAREYVAAFHDDDRWDHEAISRSVRETYSSSAMAAGFVQALRGVPQGAGA